MKIVIATPLYPPEIGRTAVYVKELVAHIQKDHDITVLAFASTSEKLEGVKLITVSKFRPLLPRMVEYTFALYKSSKNADLIYAQKAVASGLPSIVVSFIRKIPVTVNFSEDEAWDRSNTNESLKEFYTNSPKGLLIKIQGFVLRSANKIVVPSECLVDEISKVYKVNKKKIIVNHKPFEKEEILPFEVKPEINKISIVSKLLPWKNIESLIEAVSKIENIKLIIAGGGPEMKNLKSLADKLNVNVKFLGNVSKAEAWYIKNTSHVYVNSPTYGVCKNKYPDELLEEVKNALAKQSNTVICSSEEVTRKTNWSDHISTLLS